MVPAVLPAVTKPAPSIVAIPASLLLQVPLDVELLKVLLPPAQTFKVPVIGEGAELIVSVVVVKQPVGSV